VAHTVVDLVREQARRAPDAVAVEGEGYGLSYRELDARASVLAAHLRARVGRRATGETFVMYAGPRDEGFAVGALGILAAGYCLLLIDPDWPDGRQEELDALLDIAAVVGDESGVAANAGRAAHGVVLHDVPQTGAGADGGDPSRGAGAYAACTTGTSGTPKTIVTSHGALLESTVRTASTMGLSREDRVLQFTTLGVDICLEELFSAWSVGGAVVTIPAHEQGDLQRFTDFLDRHRVTAVNLPAAFWRAWLDALRARHLEGVPASLRVVGVGSEAVHAADVADWLAFGTATRVFDMYGSTEQAITSAIEGPLDLGAPLSEGRLGVPVAPMSAQVLREDLTEAAAGEPGELVVAGPSLASYYVGDPRMTAERFRPSPFGGSGVRMYCTGDEAVRLRDGGIRLLGRLDRRVKVRSFSVDLDEVEGVLASVDGVQSAHVDANAGRDGGVALSAKIGYDGGLSAEELVALLEEQSARVLPEYARPAEIVVNGDEPGGAGDPGPQVDREAKLEDGGAEAAATALWCETLGVTNPRLDESFVDLGGHSLLVARFLTGLRRRCGTTLERQDFMDRPTLRRVLEAVAAHDSPAEDVRTEALGRSGRTTGPATSGQTTMWLQHRQDPRGVAYNVPLLCEVMGELDVGTLDRVLNEVIATQPSLRTAVYSRDGAVVQEQRDVRLRIARFHSSGDAGTLIENLGEPLASFYDEPFDLSNGEVVRAAFVQCNDGKGVLGVAFHHVAVDEESLALFLRFLEQAWNGHAAEPAPTLVDVAEAEARRSDAIRHSEVEEMVEYLGTPPAISSPWADQESPVEQDWASDVMTIDMTPDMMSAIVRLARRADATLYSVACALYGLTAARFLGQREVVIGVPVSQREDATSQTLGPLVNTLPLKVSLEHNPTIIDVIKQVAAHMGVLQDHSHVPLADIVQALRARRVAGRAALVQTMVLPEPENLPSICLDDARVVPRVARARGANMDLTLIPRIWGERWQWDLVYRRARYSAGLIGEFKAMLLEAVERHGGDPDLRVGEIGALGSDSRDTIEDEAETRVLDDYGRELPRGAVGWLHPLLDGRQPERSLSGITRDVRQGNATRVAVNIGLKGRVTHAGAIEVLCGDGPGEWADGTDGKPRLLNARRPESSSDRDRRVAS
jgi:amino acid adenylation domain-containing protein